MTAIFAWVDYIRAGSINLCPVIHSALEWLVSLCPVLLKDLVTLPCITSVKLLSHWLEGFSGGERGILAP